MKHSVIQDFKTVKLNTMWYRIEELSGTQWGTELKDKVEHSTGYRIEGSWHMTQWGTGSESQCGTSQKVNVIKWDTVCYRTEGKSIE